MFTVKSAYRLAMEEKWFSSGNWQSTSRNQTCRPIWKHFWAIPVPYKVLVFGWKFINNGLATQESKRQRTIVSTGSCEICRMEEESATHALVRCGHAQALRQPMRDVWLLPNEHFFWQLGPENLLATLDGLDVDGAARVLLLLWRTWHVRNSLTHDAEKLSIEGSVRFLTKYWTELCNVQQKSSVYDTNGKSPIADSLIAGNQSKKRKEPTKWQKPDAGWIKINVDGAYDDNTREGGIGIVIRDDMMAIKLTAWKHIVRAEDAEEVEALACVEGMKLAQEWCPARAIVFFLRGNGGESPHQYIIRAFAAGSLKLEFQQVTDKNKGGLFLESVTTYLNKRSYTRSP